MSELARGPARYAEPLMVEDQPACKPGSVGHHSCEWYVTAIPLGRCLHMASSNLPGRRAWHSPRGVIAFANHPLLPSLFGFAPGGVCPAISVAGDAVRSYRTFSPLLPAFLIPSPHAGEERKEEAVRSLWHFPWGCPRRTLSGTACRWSPDFPPPRPFGACGSGRPADWRP